MKIKAREEEQLVCFCWIVWRSFDLYLGELIIRHALQAAFEHFSVPLKIVRSDEEFFGSDLSKFSIILLDPWTWAAPGKSPSMLADDA